LAKTLTELIYKAMLPEEGDFFFLLDSQLQ